MPLPRRPCLADLSPGRAIARGNRTPSRAAWSKVILVAVLLASAPFGMPLAQSEVLDLAEAAQLLRLPPSTVEQMARTGRLPARDIDGQWRFSRRALLDWLAGSAASVTVSPLPSPELAGTTGRQQSAGAGAAAIGERPAAPSAEAIALRDQGGLLRRGSGTAEIGMSYARSQDALYPVLRSETTVTSASGIFRYVPLDGVQFAARLPYAWRRTDQFVDTTALPGPAQSTRRSEGRGDASLAVQGQLLRERGGVPNVLVSLDGSFAADSTRSSGLGAGIVVSKSADPAVLFGSVSYLHALQSDRVDERSGIARRNVAFNLGVTYALNDLVALSTSFDGVFRNYKTDATGAAAGSLPPPRQVFTLQFGATWLLTRGLFLEPAVAIRVGGERPDMTFSLNLPWSF